MEQALGVRYDGRGQIKGSRALVRYADDWVVFCESEEDAQAARLQAQEWLQERGLHLSAEKTRIVHLTEGFDFLGFNVRHYPAPATARSGYKLLIKPSKESVSKFKARVRREWMALTGHNAIEVLKRLNPILRGWANYFRIGVSKHTFETLDHWMFVRCAPRQVRPLPQGVALVSAEVLGSTQPRARRPMGLRGHKNRSLPPEALLDAHKEARSRKRRSLPGRSRAARLLDRARKAQARQRLPAAQTHGPGTRPAGTLQPLRSFPLQRRSPPPPPPASQKRRRNGRALQPQAPTLLLPPTDPRSENTGKKTFRCESELLEPCARKPASTVLRGEWRSDAPFLPDMVCS